MGATNRWHSSTNAALIAWAARSGPPTVMSRPADAFTCRAASGAKSRSIRVLALDTVASVLEYTILSAACHLREVLNEGQLVGEAEHGLPGNHHLVHPAPV